MILLRRGETSFARPPRRVDRPECRGRTHHAGRRRGTPSRPLRPPGVVTASSEINPPQPLMPPEAPSPPDPVRGRLSPSPFTLSILRQRGGRKIFRPYAQGDPHLPASAPSLRRGDACVAPTTPGGSQTPKNGGTGAQRGAAGRPRPGPGLNAEGPALGARRAVNGRQGREPPRQTAPPPIPLVGDEAQPVSMCEISAGAGRPTRELRLSHPLDSQGRID